MKRRNPYDDPPPFTSFTDETDIPICQLFAPGTKVRFPWGYKYLPRNYVAPLLERGPESIRKRLSKMRGFPHILSLASQPKSYYHTQIFRLGDGGANKLRTLGYEVEVHTQHVDHELYACMFAASFELGSKKHNLPITIPPKFEVHSIPDSPIFVMRGRTVFLEADRGKKPIRRIKSDGSSVEEQLTQQLRIVAENKVTKPLFIWMTVATLRCTNIMNELKRQVREYRFPNDYMDHFAFKVVEYDPDNFNELPELSDWAVAGKYTSPAHGDEMSFV